MTIKTLRGGFFGLALCVLPSLAAADELVDLMDVYQTALANDADYAAAEFEYKNTQLNLPLARTTFVPTISVQGTASRTRDENLPPPVRSSNNQNASDEDEDDINYSGSLNVDWTLFNMQSLRTYRQTKLQVRASEAQFKDAHAELILRVAERYFELLAATDNLEVVRLQQAAIKRQRDLTKQRLSVGIGTRADLFDAEARYQQSVADTIVAQNRIDTAAVALQQVTGQSFVKDNNQYNLVALREDAPLRAPRASLDDWVARALQNNFALHAQNFNVEIARQEIKKQRAARAPRIDIRARREWREDDSNTAGGNQNGNQNAPQNFESDSSSIAATVNWTLLQGGAIHLQTKAAGYRFNAAERARESLRRQIKTDTTTAYLAVSVAVPQVKAFGDAVRAGERALRAKEEGFRAGLTTNIDVLDAQRDLSRSRTNYLRARYDFILSVLRLERAVGDLNEDDVRGFNRWLRSK